MRPKHIVYETETHPSTPLRRTDAMNKKMMTLREFRTIKPTNHIYSQKISPYYRKNCTFFLEMSK